MIAAVNIPYFAAGILRQGNPRPLSAHTPGAKPASSLPEWLH
jgi:hypothetical protein